MTSLLYDDTFAEGDQLADLHALAYNEEQNPPQPEPDVVVDVRGPLPELPRHGAPSSRLRRMTWLVSAVVLVLWLSCVGLEGSVTLIGAAGGIVGAAEFARRYVVGERVLQ